MVVKFVWLWVVLILVVESVWLWIVLLLVVEFIIEFCWILLDFILFLIIKITKLILITNNIISIQKTNIFLYIDKFTSRILKIFNIIKNTKDKKPINSNIVKNLYDSMKYENINIGVKQLIE